MKKIFKGISYILLIVLIFTYLCFTRTETGKTVIGTAAFTGISIIALLFIFPSFIFAILALPIENKTVRFCNEMFALITSSFSLISAIIALTRFAVVDSWVAYLLALFSLILLIASIISIVVTLKAEKKPE